MEIFWWTKPKYTSAIWAIKKPTRNSTFLTALFGVEMFQRTARIVADSYSSRPLLLSLWMSAGPSEPEWPEGSTDPQSQRQFWRTFVSKTPVSSNIIEYLPNLLSSTSYPQKTKLISWKTGSLIAKSYFLRFVKTNFCAHGFGKNIGKTCSFFSVPTKIFKASYGPLSWCMPSFYFLPWLLNFVLYDVMTISAPSYN